MPSSQLNQIIDQIEDQNTDHFGKFYLYVALLHKVAVHDDKTFSQLLPTHKSFGWRGASKKKLDVGNLPYQLPRTIDGYINQYRGNTYDPMESAFNIAMTYFRKGKLSDLSAIVGHMYDHLAAITGISVLNETNAGIYKGLNFSKKKPQIERFLKDVDGLNQHILSVADAGGNATAASLIALVGSITVLASGFSLLPFIIGVGLMAGGGVAAYSFAQQAVELGTQTANKLNAIENTLRQLPQDTSLFGDANHTNFVVSILKPLVYTPATALESVILNEDMAQSVADLRRDTDNTIIALASG